MNTRQAAAAIPLVIALAGTAGLPHRDPGQEVRVRAATTANRVSTSDLSLTDDQEAWLEEHNPWDIPQASHPGNWTVVVREGYTLAHNNVDLIADWVSFHLTKDYVS